MFCTPLSLQTELIIVGCTLNREFLSEAGGRREAEKNLKRYYKIIIRSGEMPEESILQNTI
jgi:hypothetical protein